LSNLPQKPKPTQANPNLTRPLTRQAVKFGLGWVGLGWVGLGYWGKLLNKTWDIGKISLVFNLFWADKHTVKFITTW